MSRTACIIPLLIICVVTLIGCGGDDTNAPADGGASNQPHPDNATVAGRVVRADSAANQPATGLSRAIVTEQSTGRSVETDTAGNFNLTGLPAGDSVRLQVSAPFSGDYDSATVPVQTRASQAVTAEIAVLPMALGIPTALAIAPQNTTVELGAQVQFAATIYVGTSPVDVEPSWVLVGSGIGRFRTDIRPGLFEALSPGNARIRAVAGDLVVETSLTVVSAQPPDISSVFLSHTDDRPVAATGGNVTFTVASGDGDGVQHVYADVFPQHGAPSSTVEGGLVAGTTFDGTWRATFAAPGNSNQPSADGVQAPQYYSVRIRSLDANMPAPGALTNAQLAQWLKDHQTIDAVWYSFRVAGLDVPPPPSG